MGYIISFGYSQGAIWFYNLRAPQICFRNFWDQKIDQVETQDGCDKLQHRNLYFNIFCSPCNLVI